MMEAIHGVRKRGQLSSSCSACFVAIITPEIMQSARKTPKRRFCSSLTEYCQHEENVKLFSLKQGKVWYWCGEPLFSFCGSANMQTQQPRYTFNICYKRDPVKERFPLLNSTARNIWEWPRPTWHF